MKRFISFLSTLIILGSVCVSCTRNVSSRPKLALFVGKIVKLRTAQYICDFVNGDSYYLRSVDPDGPPCTTVGQLGVGSRVKVLRFEEYNGILSRPGVVYAILEIMIRSQGNKNFIAELLVKNGEEDNYDFPW